MKVPSTDGMDEQARRAEAAGWTGVTYTDSQNLCPDPYVGIALAARATERLRFATGVTNAHTRHPAALATTAATVQEVSGGRFVLGIGRGDTALFHLGLPPMPVAPFVERVTALQTYLAGESVDAHGHASRIQWLARATAPKVPLDIACSGPRVIAIAASVAEHVTFALGADPDRLAWGLDHARKAAADAGRDPAAISFGAYVNIGCHPDPDAARAMIASSVSAFAHFSAMPGSTGAGLTDEDRAVVADVGRRYDSRQHLRPGAAHNEALDAGFIDRFAITGPPERVVDRINQLAALGIERLVVTGPGFGTPRDHARTANQLLTGEVLPAVSAR
jgi:5,10-methylenetetrahydromethanopterin reductase